MAKLCVITSPALADGFRLAGAEVYAVESPELAGSELAALIRREDVGLVAVESGLYDALDARLKARVESRLRPVVVSVPAPSAKAHGERRSRYVAELIQRAIGVSITVKRTG